MTTTPYHNRDSFARAIERLILQAEREGRGDDLDRLVAHLSEKPKEMTTLGSFMLLLDEDWRLTVRDEVDAFKRWGKQKGQSISEDDIMDVMLSTYRATRSLGPRLTPQSKSGAT